MILFTALLVVSECDLVKFSDNLEIAEAKDSSGISVVRCMVRHAKLTITAKDGKTFDYNVPYGANLNVDDGEKVNAGTLTIEDADE